jgi:hypothetical protein
MFERLRLRLKIWHVKGRCEHALAIMDYYEDNCDCGYTLLEYMSARYSNARRDYRRYGRLYRRLKLKLDQMNKVRRAA